MTFTATVGDSTSGTPTGTVTFLDGSTLLGTATLSAVATGAQASFTTATLALGAHSITAVYGGDGTFAGSSSPALNQTVQQFGTSTALTSSAAPAAPGQAVTLTATVGGTDGGTPAGTVTFMDGTTVLGSVSLRASPSGAQAVFTTSSLANGTHSLAAVYSGDSHYTGSTSAALSESIQQMGSSTSLFASNVSTTAGQSVTFTATVSGASGGTPTGTVTFMDGSTVLGTASLSATNSGMQATFTASALAAGTHAVTAVYSGDANYTGSTSTALSETVQLLDSITSLSTSAASTVAGQAATFTATVAGVGAGVTLPTGTVTFMDGTTVLGTATLSAATAGMQAVFTTSALTAGAHAIAAVYSGDGTFAGSTSPAVAESVQVDSTTTTLSSSALAALPGQAVTLTATIGAADGGTPTGTVTFMDGTTVLGTAALSAATSGAQAVFTTSTLADGTHSLTAVYGGDSNYTGSTSLALGELVAQVGSFAVLSSSANPATTGQAVTFTATIGGTDGQAPTGTVTFENGTTVLGTATLSAVAANATDLWSAQATFTTSSLAAGANAIQAVYGGDGNYLGSNASLSQVVGSSTGSPSSIALASSAMAAAPGQVVTFTATVTSTGSGTPTGTVTFLDGSTVLGSATLSAAGSGAQATFTTSTLANGTHVIIAVYSGDSTFAAATSTALLESVQPVGNTTTTLTSSSTASAPGQAVTFTATVAGGSGGAPAGTVAFEDGTTVLGTVTLSPNLSNMAGSSSAQATFTTSGLTLGTHSITAVYSGGNVFNASTSAVLSQTVQQDSTTTSLSSSANTTELGQALTVTATVSGSSGAMPTGTVTFEDGTTVLGTVVLTATASGAQAGFTTSALAIGSHSLTAVYSGDNSFTGSTSSALTQAVGQDSTTTALASSALSATPGQSVTFTATIAGAEGGTPTGTMTFMDGNTVLGTATLSAAPSGAQATFTTSTLADGTHTITAVYSGDSTFAASTSAGLNQFVSNGTTASSSVALASSSIQATTGQVVTFSATVDGVDGGTPTGTVSFEDGSTVLGTAALSAGTSGAQASFSTSALAAGTHAITAVYNGDSNYAASTSLALSESIQAGSSSNPGSGSMTPSMDSTGSNGSSSASTNVANLLASGTTAAAAVSTQLSTVAAASSGGAVMATNSTTSSGYNAATPPRGPLNSSSSNLGITSGSYQKHYTEWGSNASASFYLDVTSSSTFGPTGETGTLIYTASLEDNGILLVDEQNVAVSFSYPIIVAGGTTLGNLPAGGELAGLTAADFGFDFYNWDQMHYRETDSYKAAGTYNAANSSSYAFNQNSSTASAWDSVSAYTGSTAVNTNQFGNSWNYNLTASDSTANFATNPQYNANGYPTTLFAAPASGTSYLAQTFNAGSSSGLSITTNTMVGGQVGNLGQSVWVLANNGVAGSRYFYNNTATVLGSGSGNSDAVTWDINQQSTNSYGGSQVGNLVYSGSSPSGAVATTSKSGGQSASNSNMSDAYQRNGGGTQGGGLYKTGGSMTLSYTNQAAEQQTYTSGLRSADTVQYANNNSSSGSQTVSNNDKYTTTGWGGVTTGSDSSSSSSQGQAQSSQAGTNNLLTNSSTVNSRSSSSNTGSTVTLSTSNYLSNNGSSSNNNTWYAAAQSNVFSYYAVSGGFNAAGAQTSGSSINVNGDAGSYTSFQASRIAAAGFPAATYTQRSTGNYSDIAASGLTANADGSVNGSYQSGSTNSTTSNILSTLVGTQKLFNGTIVYNNSNFVNDVQTMASSMNLSFQRSGPLNGTIAQVANDTLSDGYSINVQANLNNPNNFVQSTQIGSGWGVTRTNDTMTGFYINGTPLFFDTTVTAQSGASTDNVWANAKMWDGNGHIGKWSSWSMTTASINDMTKTSMMLANNASWWTVTGQRFSINESSSSASTFHEWDNGLGVVLPPGATGVFRNTVDASANASQTLREAGSPSNFAFSTTQNSYKTQTTTNSSVVSVPAQSSGGSSSNSSTQTSAFGGTETGLFANGQQTLTNFNVFRSMVSQGQEDGSSYSKWSQSTSHSRFSNSSIMWMAGNQTAGAGQSVTTMGEAAWGTSTFLGITSSSGNQTGFTSTSTTSLTWGPNGRNLTTAVSTSGEMPPSFSWSGAAGGALTGAAVGAGLGFLIGGPAGAVVGGIVGGILGFVAGGVGAAKLAPNASGWQQFGLGALIGIPAGIVGGLAGGAAVVAGGGTVLGGFGVMGQGALGAGVFDLRHQLVNMAEGGSFSVEELLGSMTMGALLGPVGKLFPKTTLTGLTMIGAPGIIKEWNQGYKMTAVFDALSLGFMWNQAFSSCFVEGTLVWMPVEKGAVIQEYAGLLPSTGRLRGAGSPMRLPWSWEVGEDEEGGCRWPALAGALLVGLGGVLLLESPRRRRKQDEDEEEVLEENADEKPKRGENEEPKASNEEPKPEPLPVFCGVQPKVEESGEEPSLRVVEEQGVNTEPKAVASPKNAPVKQRGRVRQGLAWCALLLGLSLLGWGLRGKHHSQTPPAPVPPLTASLVSSAEPQVVVFAKVEQPEDATHSVRRIETIRVGQRVLGRNPLREQVEHGPEPEPQTWRLLHLELRKANGRQLYVDLLRPLAWLKQHQARVGGSVHLDLPEMGAQGWATVKAIDPCPEIERGSGQVVTAKFKHEPDDNILDVRLAGQEEPIGVTDTHPWWSEDRQAFVAVGQLREGERVRTASLGVVAITSIRPRPREAWVYNLEVNGEHVYQVGDAGVLVHNNNSDTVSLWRVPNRSTSQAEAALEMRGGFDPTRFPGRGLHVASDKPIAEGFQYHYQNGLQQIRIPRSVFNDLVARGILTPDGNYTSGAWIIDPANIPAFNQAILQGPPNVFFP